MAPTLTSVARSANRPELGGGDRAASRRAVPPGARARADVAGGEGGVIGVEFFPKRRRLAARAHNLLLTALRLTAGEHQHGVPSAGQHRTCRQPEAVIGPRLREASASRMAAFISLAAIADGAYADIFTGGSKSSGSGPTPTRRAATSPRNPHPRHRAGSSPRRWHCSAPLIRPKRCQRLPAATATIGGTMSGWRARHLADQQMASASFFTLSKRMGVPSFLIE